MTRRWRTNYNSDHAFPEYDSTDKYNEDWRDRFYDKAYHDIVVKAIDAAAAASYDGDWSASMGPALDALEILGKNKAQMDDTVVSTQNMKFLPASKVMVAKATDIETPQRKFNADYSPAILSVQSHTTQKIIIFYRDGVLYADDDVSKPKIGYRYAPAIEDDLPGWIIKAYFDK